MNPFVSRINRGSWELPVSALCLVLGVMISLAWIRPGSASRTRAMDVDQATRVQNLDMNNVPLEKLNAEISHLQEENTKLQNAMAEGSKQGKVLNTDLQDLKKFAGLTDLEGPGVAVTLRDSMKPVSTDEAPMDRVIHDTDVLKVVNELWAAGAEAVSVNNHRVAMSTSFRCVGPVILVDGTRIASPIVIRAIGDQQTLEGGLQTPGGVLDEIRQLDPSMVQIEKVKKQLIPAYTGSTQLTLSSVPKDFK